MSEKNTPAAEPVAVLEGVLHTWSVDPEGTDSREYTDVTIPFGVARKAFKVEKFNAMTGKGEQRDLVPAQVRALKQAMLGGTFTPTSVTVGLRTKQRDLMTQENGRVSIAVPPNNLLPLTDGQQRFGAMTEIWEGAKKENNEAMMAAVDRCPISAMVLLDGDPKADFINLQQGRSVDASHMLSLRVKAGLLSDREAGGMKVAMEAAKVLASHPDSPFAKLIRFDSKGTGNTAVSKLPITTLAARGSSDLATSLYGLAKVGGATADPAKLAYAVVAAYKAVLADAPELLAEGMPLTPPTEGGTKGSATMLVGMGVCLAYRVKALGREVPEASDLDLLVGAAEKTLSGKLDGGLSGQVKRRLMGEFATEFLNDLPGDKHAGLPTNLLLSLSASAFGADAVPKDKK